MKTLKKLVMLMVIFVVSSHQQEVNAISWSTYSYCWTQNKYQKADGLIDAINKKDADAVAAWITCGADPNLFSAKYHMDAKTAFNKISREIINTKKYDVIHTALYKGDIKKGR